VAGWNYIEEVVSANSTRLRLQREGHPVDFRDILGLLSSDHQFRRFYNAMLASMPYAAFFWEHPPLCDSTSEAPYECMIIDAPSLARAHPDSNAFREHFLPGKGVVSFANLRGDARLVVPCPIGPDTNSVHIAAFVRGASEEQQDSLWTCVGREARAIITKEPRWLSTAGLGVHWLHVRIDSQPKYYRTAGYKRYRADSSNP
jgi:hypothetical protein